MAEPKVKISFTEDELTELFLACDLQRQITNMRIKDKDLEEDVGKKKLEIISNIVVKLIRK